ncbi:hypothetical protein OB955_21865 [Halobacteria archaeon AArc-m2/3/4]|uniref:Polysaccharide deacetylase n=1 Tax=Natronoglomus mannanivorans TaxID=2979990 RepID=A0ABT2QKD0_9EURY|nr:hypothetical protein [Halobacteria archaeon AArc-m2/3/4]
MRTLTSPTRLSYTFGEYEQLLRSLQSDGFQFSDFSSLEDNEIVIRHDVDLLPEQALNMGRIEASNDVQSTYCFLLTAPFYNLLEIRNVQFLEKLRELGHQIGLHFNPHFYWSERPPQSDIEARVNAERAILGRLLGDEIDIVSFHIPPEWVLGETFDGFTNTYQADFFTDVTYRSDSNQKWRTEPPFPDKWASRIQLLIHPGLWSNEGRAMDDIVTEIGDSCRAEIETYMRPLGK